MRSFRALLAVLAALIATPALALSGGHVFVWSTAAQISALSIDTSQAGTALPAAVTNGTWANFFTDDFSDPTCGDIVDEIPNYGKQVATAKWYSSAGSMGGSAGGQFVHKVSTFDPFDCSAGYLKMTMSNPSGTQWQGPEIKTRSFGDANANHGAYRYGYQEVLFSEPVLPGAPTTQICAWFAFWTIGSPFLYRDQPWLEVDAPEVCAGGGPNPYNMPSNNFIMHIANNPTPSQLQAQTSFSALYTQNIFDGAQHRYGILFSHDYVTMYFDRIEIARVATSSLGDDAHGLNTMVVDQAIHNLPSPLDTSLSVVLSLYHADIWLPPNGSCYYIGGC